MTLNVEMIVEQPNRAEKLLAAASGQLPFATSLAINNTAKDFQKVQTVGIFARFTIRRETFARRAVKVKPFATKSRLEATVQIEPPGGPARADIFAKFESRTIKTPRSGTFLAVPIQARRGQTGVIGRANRPAALRNKRNVFVLRKREGRLPPGIYQEPRSGPLKLLYIFKRSVPIDDRLDFIDTAKRVVRERFGPNFSAAFQRALRTAR